MLLGVATLVFSLIHLIPGDPCSSDARKRLTPRRRRNVAELRTRLGLDRPLIGHMQESSLLRDAVRGGDLGRDRFAPASR